MNSIQEKREMQAMKHLQVQLLLFLREHSPPNTSPSDFRPHEMFKFSLSPKSLTPACVLHSGHSLLSPQLSLSLPLGG